MNAPMPDHDARAYVAPAPAAANLAEDQANPDCACWHSVGRLDCPVHRHEVVEGNCRYCASSAGEIEHGLVPRRCTGRSRKSTRAAPVQVEIPADAPALRQHLADAIERIELGAGSEHFRHGRETMRDDAISAVQDALAAPLLGPRPLLDRGSVRRALVGSDYKPYAACVEAHWVEEQQVGPLADAVMELARPMPTREQIAEALAVRWTRPLDLANRNEDWTYPERPMSDRIKDEVDASYRSGPVEDPSLVLRAPTCLEIADAVLALLNGAES